MIQNQPNENAARKPAAATLSLDEQIKALRAERRALRAQIRELVAARRKAGLSLRDVSRIALAASWAAAFADVTE